jgi:hypothetical protein
MGPVNSDCSSELVRRTHIFLSRVEEQLAQFCQRSSDKIVGRLYFCGNEEKVILAPVASKGGFDITKIFLKSLVSLVVPAILFGRPE